MGRMIALRSTAALSHGTRTTPSPARSVPLVIRGKDRAPRNDEVRAALAGWSMLPDRSTGAIQEVAVAAAGVPAAPGARAQRHSLVSIAETAFSGPP